MATFFWNDIYITNPSGKLFYEAATQGFSLDGLVRLKKNSLLVSSWSPPAVYMIDPSRKTISTILDESSGYFKDTGTTNPLFNLAPADIGFDHTRNKLLIPVMQVNMLVIYSMKKEGWGNKSKSKYKKTSVEKIFTGDPTLAHLFSGWVSTLLHIFAEAVSLTVNQR